MLHFGAGANAISALSSYFEFCLITVIYDFRFPCFELVLAGSFFIWNEDLSTFDDILSVL